MQASLAVQAAVVAALAAEPALAGVPVLDGPAPDARPPYATVGTEEVRVRGWKGGCTYEHRFTVMLWSASEGMAGPKQRMAAIERAVLGVQLGMAGVRLLSMRMERAVLKPGSQGWVQGALEFRALVAVED